MSDTFFTTAPDWRWWIVFYFFIGGIAGGSFFLAAMLDLFGNAADRAGARLGYYVAFPATVVSGILLTLDLKRPERFWHMLVESKTWEPAFKWWSPISFGSWGLTAFGFFAFLAFLGALGESRDIGPLKTLGQGALKLIIAALGGLFGLFVAGYTGVLLSVTNRPIWADSSLLGLLFLVSGVSTAAALLMLLARRGGATSSVRWLEQMDNWLLLLELVALVALVISIASIVDDVWANGWGVLLVVGVFLAGIVVPLALYWRPRLLGSMTVPSAAVLVLVGGFILRVVMLLSSEAV